MSNVIAYTIFYGLFVAGIVYPPREFVSAGFTISEVFSSWLGNESTAFVQYHIKRSIVTLLVHSLLPFSKYGQQKSLHLSKKMTNNLLKNLIHSLHNRIDITGSCWCCAIIYWNWTLIMDDIVTLCTSWSNLHSC